MRDGAAKGTRARRALGVGMNELPILGSVGERVDTWLGDLVPGRHTELLPDQGLQLFPSKGNTALIQFVIHVSTVTQAIAASRMALNLLAAAGMVPYAL